MSQAQFDFVNHYLRACQQSLDYQVDSNTGLLSFDDNHILHKRWQKGLQRMAGGAALPLKAPWRKKLI